MHIHKLLFIVPLLQASHGATIPRDEFPVPDGLCCFRLRDSSTGSFAQQDYHSGYLYFNANQPQGSYCFDSSYNACILSGNKGQFQCLDPIPGGDTWKLRRQGGRVVLEDYGSTKFSACNSNPGEAIFGPVPPGGMQCRKDLQLEAVNIKGDCSGDRKSVV